MKSRFFLKLLCPLAVAAALSTSAQAVIVGTTGTLTGTTTTRGDGWTVYTFEDGSGTWSIPAGASSMEVLVVGGGGTASGAWVGGGAGGGGVINLGPSSPSTGSVTVTVGTGGLTLGASGNSSTFDSLIAYGGGGGTAQFATGGSNGGNNQGGTVYAGGTNGGSGAGAGGAGNNDWGGSCSGGLGVHSSITGTSIGYGGGGSTSYCNVAGGAPSVDGGGITAYNNAMGGHPNGYANTGGGGAAGDNLNTTLGYGGSGVVIVALQFSAIPEPSSFLALGCLVGSGLMLRNRRRK
jgi:hypothetical protein